MSRGLGDVYKRQVLNYVEAMVRLFVEEGDYKNKARARIRYILERMGEEE